MIYIIDEASDLPPDFWEKVAAMPQRTPAAPTLPGQPQAEETKPENERRQFVEHRGSPTRDDTGKQADLAGGMPLGSGLYAQSAPMSDEDRAAIAVDRKARADKQLRMWAVEQATRVAIGADIVVLATKIERYVSGEQQGQQADVQPTAAPEQG